MLRVQPLSRQVYLATRNEEATKESMERLTEEGVGDGSLRWLKLDLLDPHAVKGSAEEFMKKEDRLDILSTLHLALTPFLLLIFNVVNNAAK